MPRTCTICTHTSREAVERDLIAGNASFRDIARQYRVSKDAVARHRADHLPASLVKSREAREVAQADTLMGHVRTAGDRSERLYAAAETILDRTLQAGDFKTALQGIRAAADVLKEARAYLELRGEITGELAPPPAAPSFGPSALLSVIIMPKTPEAEAEERRILAKFERLPALPGFAPPSSGSGPLRLGPKRSKATDDTRKEG